MSKPRIFLQMAENGGVFVGTYGSTPYSEIVEHFKKGDIISVYVHDMNRVDSEVGFCSDRSVIFKNGIPQKGKIQQGYPDRRLQTQYRGILTLKFIRKCCLRNAFSNTR